MVTKCFIIAEAGVNHNGNEAVALKLVDAAADTGADAVKFQTFVAAKLVTPGTASAAYQKTNTGGSDQYRMLRDLELPADAYMRLRDRARARGIEFLSTPFDVESAEMLVGLGMARIKVPSGELTNLPFLAHLAAMDLPIVLSTGMATLDEVREAVTAIRDMRLQAKLTAPLEAKLTLLHCTSDYPAAPADVNLRVMQTLRDEFRVPVGYSDHTAGTWVSVAAAAAGAAVIEKHLTLDRGLPGPDQRASLEPGEFKLMVEQVRAVETALGATVKQPCAKELPIRDLVRRSITVSRALAAGARIADADVTLLRPGTGIPPKELSKVIGRRVATDLPAGTTLQWAHLLP